MSSAIFRRLLQGPPSARLAASFAILFLFPVLVVPTITRLELRLALTVSSSVLWYLTQRCCLAAPCRNADINFASRMSRQYKIIVGKHFRVSPLHTEASKSLSSLYKMVQKRRLCIAQHCNALFSCIRPELLRPKLLQKHHV